MVANSVHLTLFLSFPFTFGCLTALHSEDPDRHQTPDHRQKKYLPLWLSIQRYVVHQPHCAFAPFDNPLHPARVGCSTSSRSVLHNHFDPSPSPTWYVVCQPLHLPLRHLCQPPSPRTCWLLAQTVLVFRLHQDRNCIIIVHQVHQLRGTPSPPSPRHFRSP